MAYKNISLEALKTHLFETLEGLKNLSDDDASPCEKVSVEQAKAVVSVSDAIVDIYKLQVDALKTFTKMDSVASQGQLMLGMGIISPDEKQLLG